MDFVKKNLSSGLRVIAVPMKNTNTVTLLVLVGTGSRYETRNINGISHFLEHMFFKGTKHYPDAGELNKRTDAIGAIHNAFTSREETGYWVKAHAKHFTTVLTFVADILQNSLIKKEEVEKERGVILEEMKMFWDTPRSYIWYVFERLLYGDQPAGWDTIGTAESLKKLKRPHLVQYWDHQYGARNTVVIVAGNISAATIFRSVDDAFSQVRKGLSKKELKIKKSKKGPTVYIHEKKTDQTHLVLGAKGFSLSHRDRFVAEVLATILGGYMSSRLFMEIRERRGLAYTVAASHQAYRQDGYFAVYAGIPHSSLGRVPQIIVREFKRIVNTGVRREELQRAKENIRGHLAIALESTDEVAQYFGMQELLLGKILAPAKVMERIDRIREDDIKRVARKMFHPENYYLALIGPGSPPGADLQKLLH